MTFAAVVVSDNRPALHKKPPATLESQTPRLDEFIAIDNGSADCIQSHPGIALFRSERVFRAETFTRAGRRRAIGC